MKLVKELPEIFEEFGEQKKQSFLEVKKYKEEGKPIIGAYCCMYSNSLPVSTPRCIEVFHVHTTKADAER